VIAAAPASAQSFLLQRVPPAMTGLIDGSLSTLAPIFAVALATHKPRRLLRHRLPALARFGRARRGDDRRGQRGAWRTGGMTRSNTDKNPER